MYRAIRAVEAKHKTTVATWIFGIIFDDLAVENDGSDVLPLDHSLGPNHLVYRMGQEQNALICGCSYRSQCIGRTRHYRNSNMSEKKYRRVKSD
jgi:hypothetical protein